MTQIATSSCDYKHCTEEDFLPQRCELCKKRFCSKHGKAEEHDCPFSKISQLHTIVCPACNEVLRVETGESDDHAVNTHIEKGKCSASRQQQQQQQQQNPSSLYGFSSAPSSSSNTNQSKSNFCSAEGCNHYEPVPVVCPNCSKNFCLKHKMPELHNCSRLANVTKNAGNIFSAANNNNNNNNNNNQNKESKKVDYDQIVVQASNTSETAKGIRPDRLVTEGDILILVTYDAERLRRLLKPVLFSVSPLTPVGRLLDAAVDHYTSLPKGAGKHYTCYSSVAIESKSSSSSSSSALSSNAAPPTSSSSGSSSRRFFHQIQDLNTELGKVVTDAQSQNRSKSFPEIKKPFFGTSDPLPVPVLSLCVTTAEIDSETGELVRTPTTEFVKTLQQVPQQKSNNSNNKTSTGGAEDEIPKHAVPLRPYQDAKGKTIHILIDKENTQNPNVITVVGSSDEKKSGGGGSKAAAAADTKKKDGCCIC